MLVFVFFLALYEYDVGPYIIIFTFTWLMLILIALVCRELQYTCQPTTELHAGQPKPLRIVIVPDYKSIDNATQNGRETTSRETQDIQTNDGRDTEAQTQEG
jgi:hypothetical protein